MTGTYSALEDIVKKLVGNHSQIDEPEEINRIMHDNYIILQSIHKDPSLKDNLLRKLYRDTVAEHEGVYNFAVGIDYADRILGPVQSLAQLAGFHGFFTFSKIAELMAKTTFAAYYLRTNDVKSVLGFAANEFVGVFFKYGSIINIYDLYKNSVKRHIREKTAEKYVNEIFDIQSGNETSKEFRQSNQSFRKEQNPFKF
jgi:hypothetical protein